MDIANNLGTWAAVGIGALFGAGMVFVLLVPKAFSLGRREGYARGIAEGVQAAGEPALTHPPVRLFGGPSDGEEVYLPPGPCSTAGFRFLVRSQRDNYRLEQHTYTIVRPHEAEHTPEEGDSE